MNSLKQVRFLLFTSSLLLLISFGLRSSFGLYVAPMSEFNGWGREVISFSIAIQNLCWGVVAFFAGGIADRFGNLKVIITAALLYALGLYLMAGVDSEAMVLFSSGVLVGSGVAGTSFGLVLPALARAVDEKHRGFVLGVGTAAGSMGQFVMVQFAQLLIDSFGWILSLQILSGSAFLMILLALPLAPYSGAAQAKNQHDESKQKTPIQAFQEAIKHPSFIFLSLGFYVCGFFLAYITVHMPSFLSDAGFSKKVGAWSISIIGICNVIGALISGILSSKLSKKLILSFIYFSRAVVTLVFLIVPISLTSIIVFSALIGFLWLATIPPTSGLVAVMFGTRYMSLLYGFVFLSHQLGSFTGVWLGGWLYDTFGNYDYVWWMSVFLALLAGLVHLPIKERYFQILYPKSNEHSLP